MDGALKVDKTKKNSLKEFKENEKKKRKCFLMNM